MKIVASNGAYRAGDVIYTADGEPVTVTAVSARSLRFTWERGWEMQEPGGDWEPYRPSADEDD